MNSNRPPSEREIAFVFFGLGLFLLILWRPDFFIRAKLWSPHPPPFLTSADKELAKLRWDHLAYAAPEHMELGSIAGIDAALGGGKSVVELSQILTSAGKREGFDVQVSPRVEASLTGQAFEITASSPAEQAVGTKDVTHWRWQVKAKEPGVHDLYLSFSSAVTVNGKDTKKEIRPLEPLGRKIIVEATTLNAWLFWIKENWTLVAAVVAWTAALFA